MSHWDLVVRFGSWGESNQFDRFRLRQILSMLTSIGAEAYRVFPRLRSVLGGDVRYELRRSPAGCCPTCGACTDGNDVYADVLAVVERGSAPCGPLSAALAGEMRTRHGDERAQAAYDWTETEERPYVHVVAMKGDGTIVDPSDLLLHAEQSGNLR